MSGSFAGFSEEDIKNLNNKSNREIQKQERGLKRASLSSNVIKKTTTSRNHRMTEDTMKTPNVESIPEAAKLCTTSKTAADVSEIKPMSSINTQETFTEESANKPDEPTVIVKIEEQDIRAEDENQIKNNFVQLQEKKLDLKEFQERQKIIEEQNKKRKELLAKALAVRTQQTKEEAQKLEAIRNEFKKLDVLLSGDVKILRHQIEIASLDYMEAEKRYFRIEKEFLEAKLALHQKLEKKEMLTEHLCAVIEKNEERKAEKLNSLLSKLNLKTDFELSTEASDLHLTTNSSSQSDIISS